MRTQEQISVAAQKKNVAFAIYKRESMYFDEPWFEVCMSGAWDGYCTCAWFDMYDNGRVYCSDGYPTKTMYHFANRLFHQNSNLHECDWTY